MEDNIQLIHGDCLVEMQKMPDKSVDAIICDLPYGTTACAWDSIIPFDKLWEQYNRIIKDNGAICLFGSEPFSSMLRMSNLKMYRYDLIWDKKKGTDFQLANKKPLKSHENISVFYKRLPQYNPQKTKGKPYVVKGGVRKNGATILTDRILNEEEIKNYKEIKNRANIAGLIRRSTINDGDRFPLSIISIPKEGKCLHPTQKPVALLEYLVKTYTNEGEIVLDNTAGSMTTAVAALNTNRRCICIEKDDEIFKVGEERVKQHIKELKSRLF